MRVFVPRSNIPAAAACSGRTVSFLGSKLRSITPTGISTSAKPLHDRSPHNLQLERYHLDGMSLTLGATWLGDGRCRFLVWAPHAQTVEVLVLAPQPQTAIMERIERGYYEAIIAGVGRGSLYVYRLDGSHERPDVASGVQPQGVHGPSQVADTPATAGDDDCLAGLPHASHLI